ncbi:MAG: hypothetical protein ACT4P3_21180 [Betaproteobacteria bacterium]
MTLAAFLLRQEIAETYLSVNWLESLPGADQTSRLASLRVEIAKTGYGIAKTAKYAVLHVGTARKTVHEQASDQRWIRVAQETVGFPRYHAGIHDTATEEMVIAQALVDSVGALAPA